MKIFGSLHYRLLVFFKGFIVYFSMCFLFLFNGTFFIILFCFYFVNTFFKYFLFIFPSLFFIPFFWLFFDLVFLKSVRFYSSSFLFALPSSLHLRGKRKDLVNLLLSFCFILLLNLNKFYLFLCWLVFPCCIFNYTTLYLSCQYFFIFFSWKFLG